MRSSHGGARRVTHVVGARPNFVKAAPVIRALSAHSVEQIVIHTGQHYDDAMSDVFFRELGLPAPDVNLGVGSGSHAEQTAALLIGLEREFIARRPDAVIVYGDVNSTLAAALAAAKLSISIVHVESGLRSFDDSMPEELNRRLTDQLAGLLLTTSPEAEAQLVAEGRPAASIRFVGNTMIDSLEAHRSHLDPVGLAQRLGLPSRWAVATVHRPANVDATDAAREITAAIEALSAHIDVVIPVHPRSRARLLEQGLGSSSAVHVIDPLGYRDFLSLMSGATLVVTDSGGVQEETTMLGIPCLTARTSTERPITISHGTNRLVRVEEIAVEAAALLSSPSVVSTLRPPLWDGRAGERCADEIMQFVARVREAAA
jgi:UDP-N-acetylglucosamine 2-epimerase (non-hydrolysing)